MLVTLEEMKQYLRVDFADDDSLITYLLSGAEKICMDIMRTDDTNAFASEPNAKTAILYTVAYLYEHREDADHHALVITLRALLFGSRREEF
ncbi:MAG: head-tail connector protein [Erysipelotrichaceae bacterium]